MVQTSGSLPVLLNTIMAVVVSGSITPLGLFKAKVVDPTEPEISARIVGGGTAPEYPAYAFTAGDILCGGTLIHPDIVLTAAHCKGGFVDGVLIGGTRDDGSESVFHSTAQELPHPDFNRTGVTDNDIMLVKLTAPSTTPVIEVNYDASFPPVGTEVTVIGYGNTADGGSTSSSLLEAKLITESFAKCDGYFGSMVDELQICTVGDGVKDACQGDSGGPMLTSNGNVAGIVSFGDGCAKVGAPGVFARTSGYKDFIQDGICQLSANPPSTCSPNTTPVSQPTASPIKTPTKSPVEPTTTAPTHSPTGIPTSKPAINPTTSKPTGKPTNAPTANPTGAPVQASVGTAAPVGIPSSTPSEMLVFDQTPSPATATSMPVDKPFTESPTNAPISTPTTPTDSPIDKPTPTPPAPSAEHEGTGQVLTGTTAGLLASVGLLACLANYNNHR